MAEYPITFTEDMVCRLLDEENPLTQTRRVMKTQPQFFGDTVHVGKGNYYICPRSEFPQCVLPYSPYGQIGDTLWVQETWRLHPRGNRYVQYKAGGLWVPSGTGRMYPVPEFGGYDLERLAWRPSIRMPKWASRIKRQVVGLRVEQVQDITRADAMAEGIGDPNYDHELYGSCLGGIGGGCGACENCDPISYFHLLWDSINKARGHGWRKNDWVWVVSFKEKMP